MNTNTGDLYYNTFDDGDTYRQERPRKSQALGTFLFIAFLLVVWQVWVEFETRPKKNPLV
jgi:hypothetical protein